MRAEYSYTLYSLGGRRKPQLHGDIKKKNSSYGNVIITFTQFWADKTDNFIEQEYHS